MVGGGMMDGVGTLLVTGMIAIILVVVMGIAGVLYWIFGDHKTFKTKEKPAISWELKAKGQNIDTIWVYKFK